MNDIDLLDFMVRQYQTQAKLSEALKIDDSTISKWRKRGKLHKGWRMYFQAQFDKTDESREAMEKKVNDMMAQDNQALQSHVDDLAKYANDIGQAAMRNAGMQNAINVAKMANSKLKRIWD